MNGANCSILLVEDEAPQARSRAEGLRKLGYSVAWASSGEEAVERFRAGAEAFDLVLMDAFLGAGMDGADSAREILKVRQVPVVFLFSPADEGAAEKAEAVGSYGFAAKESGAVLLDISMRSALKLFHEQGRLARSEDKFSRAFSLSPDSININRLSDGVYVDVNGGFTEMTGYSREEVMGRSSLPGDLGIWVRAEDRERLVASMREKGEAVNLEAEFRRKDGSVLTGLMSARVIEVEGEQCLLSITRDITERKLAERSLASLNRIQAVVRRATQLILHETDTERLLDGACRIAVEEGRLRMAWIGVLDEGSALVRPVASAGLVDGYLDDIRISLSDARTGQGPTGTALRAGRLSVSADIERDDRMAWREAALKRGYRSMAAFPLRSGPKTFGVFNFYSEELGYFGEEETNLLEQLALDISFALESLRTGELRGEAEDKLRRSELLYRESFMQSSAVKLLVDPDTMAIVDANLAAAEFYGYGIPVLRGMKVTDLNVAPPERVQANVELVRNREKNRFVFRHRLSSGEIRDVEVFSSPIELGGGALLHSIVHDITEQKRAELALAASESRFRTAFEDAPVGMALADPVGRILGANKAFGDMLGRPPAELASLPYSSFTHPDDLEASAEAVRSCVSGERKSARLVKRYLHRDGHPVWSDVSLSLFRDEAGEPQAFIIHMLDIGERMQYEERLKLLVLQKETLMKELQHRVKNNLNVVSGLLGLEGSRCPDERSRQAFADAMSRVDSIAAIYDRLCRSEDESRVELGPYVEDLAKSLFEAYSLDPARVALRVDADSVRLDTKKSVPLGLILNELVSNALKYAYPGEAKGEVRIELKADGGRVTLTVSDDGVGLPGRPPSPEGEGLGMMLVRMLTEQLGGRLSIGGAKGTRASISFDA
jgi:PAS domain S-box-containing protein